MASISLQARGVAIDIPDTVVEQLQREQGLTRENIVKKFAAAVDRIIDNGSQIQYEYYIEHTLR